MYIGTYVKVFIWLRHVMSSVFEHFGLYKVHGVVFFRFLSENIHFQTIEETMLIYTKIGLFSLLRLWQDFEPRLLIRDVSAMTLRHTAMQPQVSWCICDDTASHRNAAKSLKTAVWKLEKNQNRLFENKII
jgi:hypothetical protein